MRMAYIEISCHSFNRDLPDIFGPTKNFVDANCYREIVFRKKFYQWQGIVIDDS